MSARIAFDTALRDAALAVLTSGLAAEPAPPSRHLHTRAASGSSPLATALERLQGRRRLILAWHLFWGPRPFGELSQLAAGVRKRTLRHELRALEASGLVEQRPGSADGGETEYFLTPLGEALKPALASLYLWGLHVQERSGAAPSASSRR